MNRAEKQQQIVDLNKEFRSAVNAYLVEFTGMNVSQVDSLRRRTREASARYRVVKNRLALRAAEGTPMAAQAELFDGPTAVAYTGEDPVALAKILADFEKKSSLKVKGMVIDGKPMPASALQEIVSLPTRPEIISQFAGMLLSPLQKFVTMLKSPIRDFASALHQLAEKKQ